MESNINKIKKVQDIKPESAWKSQTKSRLLELEKEFVTKSKSSGRYREFILFIKTFYMRKKLMFAFSFIFIFASIGGSLAFLISKNGSNEIRGQRRTEIIQKIVENNAYSQARIASANNSNVASTLTATNGNNPIQEIIQDRNNYFDKLISQTEVIQFGPKQCVGINPPSYYNNSEFTRVSYNGVDGSYLSKTVNRLEDGRIENYFYSYSVVDGEFSKSRNVEYRGGKFALETTSSVSTQQSITMPMPQNSDESFDFTDMSLEEQFSSMFGPDAKLYEIDRDGKKLIAIENSFNVTCEESSINQTPNQFKSPDFWNGEDNAFSETMIGNATITMPAYENTDSKAIIVELINPETFISEGFENYVNEVNESSLVYKSIVKQNEIIQTSDITTMLIEVEDNLLEGIEFITEDISQLYTIDTFLPEVEKENHVNNGIEIFKETNSKILITNSELFGVNIYGQPDININLSPNEKYYTDRDFYLEGSIGDRQLEEYKKLRDGGVTILPAFPNQDKQLIQFIEFTPNPSTDNEVFKNIKIGSTVYKSDINDMDIVNNLLFGPAIEKSIDEIELIDNLPKARVYKYKQKTKETYLSEKVENSDPSVIPDFKIIDCLENLCEQSGFIIIQDLGSVKQTISVNGNMTNDYEVEYDGKKWITTNPESKDAFFREELIQELNLRLIDPSSEQDINLLRDLINKALDFQEALFIQF